MIGRRPAIDSTANTGSMPPKIIGNIELKEVSFWYPSRPDNHVLKDVSLRFPVGKITALVGHSGSGKSSIIDLVERFYDPISGEILLDEYPLTELNVRWLRQQIGIVNQQPGLFAESIFENIRYGLIGTRYESAPIEFQKQLIMEAAAVANAHSFILKLAKGYDTYVGDKGSMLSGGQKQRIAIARAIISNPKILLLDEATSAIDFESEKQIVAHLDKSKFERTTIIVAHRLSTIKSADNIIVMAHGAVIEQGTHNELMALDQAYAKLVKAGKSEIVDNTDSVSSASQEEFHLAEKPFINHMEPLELQHSSIILAALNSIEMDVLPMSEQLTTLTDVLPKVEQLMMVQDSEVDLISLDNQEVYSAWTLLRFAASFNNNDAFINFFGLFCCILCGAEESVNAILFAKSTVSLSLPSERYSELLSQVGFWALMYLMLAIVQVLAFSGQGAAFAISSQRMGERLQVF